MCDDGVDVNGDLVVGLVLVLGLYRTERVESIKRKKLERIFSCI